MSKRHAAAGLMHNQVDLPSRHSGQCEIGAHLPYLIFLGNRSQLLLFILCSLPFTFSFISLSGFVAPSVKYCGFFLLILLRPPTQHLCSPLIMQRSFILFLHSSIPSKSPLILCSSLSSMSFFYLSSNFFQPSYQSFSVPFLHRASDHVWGPCIMHINLKGPTKAAVLYPQTHLICEDSPK